MYCVIYYNIRHTLVPHSYRRRYTVKLSVLHENCTHEDERHQSLSLELLRVRETMRDSSEVNGAREQLALSRYWPFTQPR